MLLSARVPCLEDIAGCYRVCYAAFGYPAHPGENVARELRLLWNSPTTVACVVEDGEAPPARRVVGYWDAAFVSDAFVRWAYSDMPPFVNPRLCEPLPEGSRALLAEQDIAPAQAGDGLNLLVTHWGWDVTLPDADRLRVQERLSREFFHRLRGYNVKEVLIEVVGADLFQLALSLGYRLRRSHGEDPYEHRLTPDLRPFLVGASRAEATLGAWLSPLFVHTPAHFHFTTRQQALLRWVLECGNDTGFSEAQAPPLSAGGVKKRWDEIFARVARARREAGLPPLFPEAEGCTRGPEKRRLLLAYLREHPEELRPTQ